MINIGVLQEVIMGLQIITEGPPKRKEHLTSKWVNVVFNHEPVTKSNHEH